MDKNKEIRSNFVGIPGILFLLALCIITTYFQFDGLPIFLFFALLLVVTAFLWGRKALEKLEVALDGESCRVFPGETIRFSVSVSNQKLLPLLWLETEIPQPKNSFLEANDGFSRRFTWLMPWQTLTWKNHWSTLHRGVCTLDQITLTSGDGLGLSVNSQSYSLHDSMLLVVYPRVFPVNTQGFLQDTSDLQPSKRGYHEDPTLLRSSRSYQPGDNSRHINWRVLARQGEMTINLYEHLQPRRVSFLLDLASFTTWKIEETNQGRLWVLDEFHQDHLEVMISLAASCILSLTEQNIHCALMLPRTEKQAGIVLCPDLEETIPELLTPLSALDYQGEICKFPLTEIQRNIHHLGQVYVLCESPRSITCQNVLDSFAENRICLLSHEASVTHPIYRVRDLPALTHR